MVSVWRSWSFLQQSWLLTTNCFFGRYPKGWLDCIKHVILIIFTGCFIYLFNEFAYFFMTCILFHFNLMIFETPIPGFLPRMLSQVSRHGDVHCHLETRKHETPGKDSGGEGEDGPEDHVCKSNKHVAVPRIFQTSDDGFLKNMLIFSEPRSRFTYINIYIYVHIFIYT